MDNVNNPVNNFKAASPSSFQTAGKSRLNTKKSLFLLSFLILLPSISIADQFDGFKSNITRDSLKPFARDLGGILGANAGHTGRPLGFPGVDLGIHVGGKFNPDNDNKALRNSGVKAFAFPWIQAEIGLPLKIDGFIRAASFQSFTLSGGGLRYGIFKVSSLPFVPQLSAAVMANAVAHDFFSATHFGGHLIGSMRLPFVTPYILAGADRVRFKVIAADDPTLVGLSATTWTSRFGIGAQVKPIPLLYLHGAYTWTHSQGAFQGGIGVRF